MDSIWKDIIKNAFGSCCNIILDVICPEEISNKPYEHMIILGIPSSNAENIILNYCSRNNVCLYYMGYCNTIVNVNKFLKYNRVYVFQEHYDKTTGLQLMEIQRHLGTDKVNVISNPIYSYMSPNITKRVTYRYGILLDTLDEGELLKLSNVTEIYIGVLDHNIYDMVEQYCNNRGLNASVYIIDTMDSFHAAFNTCERVVCHDYYIPLCEICNIIPIDKELESYRLERTKNIAKNRCIDWNTILVGFANNIDRYTDVTLSEILEGDYKKYHKEQCQGKKIFTTYGPYSHLSTNGGVKLVNNMVDLFIRNKDCSLTYSDIPINYPWIGIMDQYTEDLFLNTWFQLSLSTCMGFIVHSKLLYDKIKDRLTNYHMELYKNIHVEIIFPSIPTHKHISKHHNKLIAVGGDLSSIFQFNRLEGYNKYYYGFTLPDVIVAKNDEISDMFILNYGSIVYNVKEPQNSPVKNEIFWKLHKDITSASHTVSYHDADVLFTKIPQDEIIPPFILIYAIIHCIPVIVNRTKLTLEYLGDQYPLYSDTSNLIGNINNAREYLKVLQVQYPIQLEDTQLYKRLY